MNKLLPNRYATDAFSIDYKDYYDRGFRSVIFDIDNTLVFDNAPADERAEKFLGELKNLGFKVLALSNNNEARVRPFCEQTGIGYICGAGKPSIRGYVRAMESLGTDRETTLFVGDQIFTDIWGARRSGVHCILTKPLSRKEIFVIVLKRIPEKLVLLLDFRRRRRMLKNEE